MRLLSHVRDRLGRAVRFHPPSPERRHAVSRPQDGAARSCPSCAGVLIFRESYRVLRVERDAMEPAWTCQTHPCGYREFVRK